MIVNNKPQQRDYRTKEKESIQLCLYNSPPMHRVSVQQFEQSALDRLHLLNYVESLDGIPHSIELAQNVLEKIRERSLADEENDRYSHFTLRLAFCGTEESRRWLLKNETRLFKCRFDLATSGQKEVFLRENGFQMEMVSEQEYKLLMMDLHSVPGCSKKYFEQEILYKVPFQDALDLIASRQVLVRNGMAYVWSKDVLSIIVAAFRSNLSQNIAATYRASGNLKLKNDGRIQALLKTIASNPLVDRAYGYKASAVTISGAPITASMIKSISKESFPLCMLHLQQSLQRDHHLRYYGRQQFGLFLKGIGLSLEESLRFWKESFQGKVTVEKFDKEYAYNIRYNYGKEGRRADYTPFSCSKIISNNAPGQGEHHGCPFKHFDESHLREKLTSVGVAASSCNDLVSLVKQHHYQVACQHYFMLMHPGAVTERVGMHPNAYFEESRRYLDTARQKESQSQFPSQSQSEFDSQ